MLQTYSWFRVEFFPMFILFETNLNIIIYIISKVNIRITPMPNINCTKKTKKINPICTDSCSNLFVWKESIVFQDHFDQHISVSTLRDRGDLKYRLNRAILGGIVWMLNQPPISHLMLKFHC